METLALAITLIIGGIYFGIRNLRFLRNDDALRTYMQTSQKARVWVQKRGLEDATRITRRVFIPIGIVASCAMVSVGIWALWRLYA